MATLTNARNDEYELLHDAYYGTGMFAAGGALQQHPREDAKNYAFRQQLSYFLNHTAPIINACVDPIFKDTISRNYNENELFETFINDVDRLGTTLQEFMRYNSTQAKIYGVMYVLVDNVSEIGETVADQVNNRQLPYLVAIEPKSVYKWLVNDIGELDLFTYTTTVFDDEGKAKTQYHEWTRTSWTVRNEEQKVIATGEHKLGKVPIVQWFGRSSRKIDILPPPEYLAIAKTNHQVYHLCSLLTQILNMQTFSTLTLPDNGQGADDITLGTNNVLLYPAESSHAPGFIAPDRGPAEIIMSVIKMLVDDMYRLSGINSVIGVQEAKSGVAKQWDFERTNQRLADFSVQCESAEKDIIELFELWTNMNVDYKCDYPREFKINDITDSLAQSQAVLDLGLGSNTLKVETGKKVLDSYMPNIEPETFDEIVAEIEESVQRQEQDETYHNNNDDEVEGGAEDEDATRDKQGNR